MRSYKVWRAHTLQKKGNKRIPPTLLIHFFPARFATVVHLRIHEESKISDIVHMAHSLFIRK